MLAAGVMSRLSWTVVLQSRTELLRLSLAPRPGSEALSRVPRSLMEALRSSVLPSAADSSVVCGADVGGVPCSLEMASSLVSSMGRSVGTGDGDVCRNVSGAATCARREGALGGRATCPMMR